MRDEIRKDILKILVNIQKECAPITVRIGSTRDGRIYNDEIVIISAPPIVASTLLVKGYGLDIEPEGAKITYC